MPADYEFNMNSRAHTKGIRIHSCLSWGKHRGAEKYRHKLASFPINLFIDYHVHEHKIQAHSTGIGWCVPSFIHRSIITACSSWIN